METTESYGGQAYDELTNPDFLVDDNGGETAPIQNQSPESQCESIFCQICGE